MYKQGTLIAIKGAIWEYDQYDEVAKMHIAHEVEIDDEGNLTATYAPYAFTDEELKDNAVNFTQSQWYGIVAHFIRQAHDLTEEDIETATEDIVGRCFAYGIPKFEVLPEYIAEYLDR